MRLMRVLGVTAVAIVIALAFPPETASAASVGSAAAGASLQVTDQEELDEWFDDEEEVGEWRSFEAPTNRPSKNWYGMQTLLTSLGAAGIVISGAFLQVRALVITGAVAYYAGPAAVHALHGNYGTAALSVLMHAGFGVALGLTVFFVSTLVAGDSCNNGCFGPAINGVGGFALGSLVAIVVDSFVLAEEPSDTWAVAPQLSYDGDQAYAGVRLQF